MLIDLQSLVILPARVASSSSSSRRRPPIDADDSPRPRDPPRLLRPPTVHLHQPSLQSYQRTRKTICPTVTYLQSWLQRLVQHSKCLASTELLEIEIEATPHSSPTGDLEGTHRRHPWQPLTLQSASRATAAAPETAPLASRRRPGPQPTAPMLTAASQQ